MSDIQITDLTNATADNFGAGTGIFDKLMQTVTLHIKKEYEEGRVAGTDYATVYLGSMQSVLAQSVQFLLQEQQAGKQADLIDSQIRESEEKIDLIAAQTAKEYEMISSSQSNTTRENLLNNKQVIKLQKEAVLIERQVDKVTAEAADQIYVTANLRPQEVALLTSRNTEQIAATIRNDNESTQKIALMSAQTLGFASDTKQKILKQMNDGFAVVLSIAGQGNVPEANQDAAIDALVQELLQDIGSTVTIGGEVVVPPL